MKFNKSQKDNIIKMTNQEAKDLIVMLDFLINDASADLGYNQTFRDFFNGLKNLSNIGS